jgi:hypothetical protein
VLALGTSHMNMGVRPDVMTAALAPGAAGGAPLVFNFSANSCGPTLQLLFLRRLLRAGVRPDVLLVEVWPVFLEQDGTEGINGDFPYFVGRLQSPDLSVAGHNYSPARRLYRTWLLDQLLLCHSHRSTLLGVCVPRWLPEDDRPDVRWRGLDGWGFQHVPGYEVHSPERFRSLLHTGPAVYGGYFGRFRVTEAADYSLTRLLRTCHLEHIRVMLVRMPESSMVRNSYTPAMQAKLDGYLRRLAAGYDVPVVDARKWIADEGFGDGEHMVAAGAVRFSERLAREALGPFLRVHVPAGTD